MRVLAGGDFHCGHFAGLTPPEWWEREDSTDPWIMKILHTQKLLWNWYADKLSFYKPFDVAILDGDLVDGPGKKSGGTEQKTTDRHYQGRMAVRCAEEIDATEYHIVRGTPYHTGDKEDFEDVIASRLGARSIKDHLFLDIHGKIFDVKHKIASSSTPYGTLTPLAKNIVWNRLNHLKGEQPLSDVLIRAHTHTFDQCKHDGCLGFILPGLQGFGSKYGKRQIDRSIDFGFVVFDVTKKGNIAWEEVILPSRAQKVEIISCLSPKRIAESNGHHAPGVEILM